MNCQKTTNHIVGWLNEKVEDAKLNGFVVGVSGGVDSALVSTLCALMGKRTVCLNMPISQAADQYTRANRHIDWLKGVHENVEGITIDLTDVTDSFMARMTQGVSCTNTLNITDLARANIRSRLRMVALYAVANTNGLLVAGTGNKVEDFGVSFFTKYGDGGVDVSPIGGLMKSEVRELSKFLGVLPEICEAEATDGLWADNRSDESSLGAFYDELEWAMNWCNNFPIYRPGKPTWEPWWEEQDAIKSLTGRQREVLKIYMDRHEKGQHKMQMPPICTLPDEIKE